MKVEAFIIGICLMMSLGSISYPSSELVASDTHDLGTTILCDSFRMNGEFDLKFKTTKFCSIQVSNHTPTPINFSSLHIDSNSISIDDFSLEMTNGKIRIDAQPTAQLFFYEGPSTYAQGVYISRITDSNKKGEMTFNSISSNCRISLESNSKIYLENKYSNSKEWVIRIKGQFRAVDITGDKPVDYPIMENKKIRFTGSLEVENPELCDSENIKLNINFLREIDSLHLNGGQVLFISDHDYSPNRYLIESNEINYKDEVIEDEFRIDMTKNFYKTDKFLKEFHIENICDMDVYKIEMAENKLSIKSHIKYLGETYFPRVKVTTKYFLVNKDNTIGDPLIVISNLEPSSENKSMEFFVGRKYKAEICIEKLAKNITVNYSNKDFKENDEKTDVTDYCYEYYIRCSSSYSREQPIECYTNVTYQKKGEEKQFTCRTESFFAIIQSGVEFEIYPPYEEIEREIDENEIFSVSKNITLKSETSDPIKVHAFLIIDRGFKIESDKSHFVESLRKEDSMEINVDLRTPFVRYDVEHYDIKILVFYQMEESDYYTLFLPDPTKDATIVENITVKKEFWNHILDKSDNILTLILTCIFTFIIGNKAVSKVMIPRQISEFLKKKKYFKTILEHVPELFTVLIVLAVLIGIYLIFQIILFKL